MTRTANGIAALAATGLAPRGLSRLQAAAYIGVSVVTFDGMVHDGRMPRGKRINAHKDGGRIVWDRQALDVAFAALPDTDGRVEQTADDTSSPWGRARA